MISIQKVEMSKAVQVHNTAGIKHDILQLYFDNEGRSGGGQFRNILDTENQNCVIVEFENADGKLKGSTANFR